MCVRSISAAALLSLVGLAPALARDAVAPSVTPAHALAGKDTAQRLAKIDRGFAGRIARLGSIMGPERAAPLNVPTKPSWTRSPRREADAAASIR